jgi:prepilin-type processing-associated H-X9-DG protein
MFPHARIRVAEITDGTSSTMIISEITDFLWLTNDRRVDWNPSLHGFTFGNHSGTPPSFAERSFSATTLRHRINQKTGWALGPAPANNGDCTLGVCFNNGSNSPLRSTHLGGVNAGFADGSVRFLPDSTSQDILGALATRDDGQVVTLP